MENISDYGKDLRSLTIEKLNSTIKEARQTAKKRLGRPVLQEWPDEQLSKKLVHRKGGQVRAVFEKLHNDFIADFTGLKDVLEAEILEQLALDGFYISNITLDEKQEDPDGTIKYRFRTSDGHCFESVMMFLKNRTTGCLSSQIGCRMGCRFCATSRLKFIRSLSAGEIAAQLHYLIANHGGVDNVVYMGMGEPFDNYDAVSDSIEILSHYAGPCVPPGRLTVSTCGLPNEIMRMADDSLKANLAVSLHSATDGGRGAIMAAARKYSLSELLGAVKYYYEKTGKRVLMEYCMIESVNDSDADCAELMKLLSDSGVHCSVNLIEFNSHESCEFKPSGRERISYFCDQLMNVGIETTIRFKRGEMIKAACGQLCNQ